MPDQPTPNDAAPKPDSSSEDNSPSDRVDIEADRSEKKESPEVTFPEPTKKELEALKLSAIESEEVNPDDNDSAAVDPDHEVKIMPPVVQVARPWWKKWQIIAPLSIAILVLLVLAIPISRYALLSSVVHKSVTVTVKDARTGGVVADANVTIAGKSASTGHTGQAVVEDVPIGNHAVTIEKRYYGSQSSNIAVDLITTGDAEVTIQAKGVIVPLTVIDRFTQKPVTEAVVASKETTFGKTGKSGKTDVVIPEKASSIDITVTSPKYNVLKASVTSKMTTLELIPSGSIYFLDKKDEKLEVVKTNYDGSNRKVVVPATGNETDRTTMFLASKDWKYGALHAKRAPNKPESLYLVTTKDDKYITIDESAARFTVIGWSGHHFVYQATRLGNDSWREKSTTLKSFDAQTGKTTILDENASDPASTADAAAYETMGAYSLTDATVSYAKTWVQLGAKSVPLEGKETKILTIKPDGTDRKTLKTLNAAKVTSVAVKTAEPGRAYYTIDETNPTAKSYGELTAGTYRDLSNGEAIGKTYAEFILSPDGNKTLWSEENDGKYTVYVGDKMGGDKKAVIEKGEYQAYAWLTNDLLIVQKDDQELSIMPMVQSKSKSQPLKVSSYFRINNPIVMGYGAR